MKKEKEDIIENLFKAHYKELYIHAFSFVRDEEEARDIVNDAFEYLWSHYRQLDMTGSLRPLLFTLVRNRSIDYLRKEKARQRFTHQWQDEVENTPDFRQYEELIQKTMKLISEMPTQTAHVFRKCFLEKKTYKETGEELHISINTVRTHISKALRLLRQGLSDEEMPLLLLILKKR